MSVYRNEEGGRPSVQTTINRGSGANTDTTIGTRPVGSEGTRTLADIVGEAGWGRRQADILREEAELLSAGFGRVEDDGLREILRLRTSHQKKEPLVDRLNALSDLGFGWADLARIFGVSVPALRKWRHGEAASPSNDFRVAEMVALCEMLAEDVPTVGDVASWLEMPLTSESPVTGIDLLVEGRIDLVLRYARSNDGDVILDQFDPGWRERPESPIEVVVGPDGLPALTFRDR